MAPEWYFAVKWAHIVSAMRSDSVRFCIALPRSWRRSAPPDSSIEGVSSEAGRSMTTRRPRIDCRNIVYAIR